MRRIMTCLLVMITVPKLYAADQPELTPLTVPPVQLPAPTLIVPSMPIDVGFSRPNRWDVWQYYAVDRTGHWRPRVALGAGEPYYLYNGVPFLLLPVRPRELMTYILD